MDKALDDEVRRRAGYRCEYCHLPQSAYRAKFQIDHIIAQQHKGPTALENLALACVRCNLFKGPNLSGFDDVNRQVVPLFHPRQQNWKDHFRWAGPILVPLTNTARVTIAVLNINHVDVVAVRAQLMEEGILFD